MTWIFTERLRSTLLTLAVLGAGIVAGVLAVILLTC